MHQHAARDEAVARMRPGAGSCRPVEHSALFDAVVADEGERVLRIEVKSRNVDTRWVRGAFRIPGRIYHELHDYGRARGADDEYVGILVNAWLAQGG